MRLVLRTEYILRTFYAHRDANRIAHFDFPIISLHHKWLELSWANPRVVQLTAQSAYLLNRLFRTEITVHSARLGVLGSLIFVMPTGLGRFTEWIHDQRR